MSQTQLLPLFCIFSPLFQNSIPSHLSLPGATSLVACLVVPSGTSSWFWDTRHTPSYTAWGREVVKRRVVPHAKYDTTWMLGHQKRGLEEWTKMGAPNSNMKLMLNVWGFSWKSMSLFFSHSKKSCKLDFCFQKILRFLKGLLDRWQFLCCVLHVFLLCTILVEAAISWEESLHHLWLILSTEQWFLRILPCQNGVQKRPK